MTCITKYKEHLTLLKGVCASTSYDLTIYFAGSVIGGMDSAPILRTPLTTFSPEHLPFHHR